MKKTYISPLAEVVKTEIEQMICQSIGAEGLFDNDALTPAEKVGDFEDIFEGLW